MIEIDGHHLSIEQVVSVSRHHEQIKISRVGLENISRVRGWLEEVLETDKPVYGINTGFGIFAEKRISQKDSAQLSRNLILSHAVGTGPALADEIVRAAMLVRANTLTKGFSGVRKEVIQTLLDMLSAGVTPEIPSQGSLGSSGDLSPLSHMVLVMSTDAQDKAEESGWAVYQGKRMRGKDAMQAANLQRLILGPKEGLALNNGATFSAALGALTVHDAKVLASTAEIALSMSLEALMGSSAAFDSRLHEAREQHGQMRVATAVREYIAYSTLINGAGRVQDAYSLRCAPQVQGAVRDTVDYCAQIIEREINAATDNPLLFSAEEIISGGNFHGEPVGLVMDFLGIAAAELAAISERRIFRLTDGNLNSGLPPMLVDNAQAAGLNSGLMMPQYTAASLVLENQTLAHPDSVHSLPTSGGQEDHNANAMTAARHARQILENGQHILAIELYTAARALDLRLKQFPEARLGAGTRKAFDIIRSAVPYQTGDALWGPEIEIVKEMIRQETFDIS
ncbi:MAG: histidine ammonia-lyase [Bellilinea sp.]